LQKRKTRQGDNYIKNKAMRQPYKKKRKSKRRPQHMARRPPLNFPWAAKPQTTGGTSQKKKREYASQSKVGISNDQWSHWSTSTKEIMQSHPRSGVRRVIRIEALVGLAKTIPPAIGGYVAHSGSKRLLGSPTQSHPRLGVRHALRTKTLAGIANTI
jgi:hypothetical protein